LTKKWHIETQKMTPSIAQNPPNCKHIPSSSSPLNMDYLASMHRMVPGEKEPQPEDHPAVMANILAAQGAGRAANCPDCPECPAKWPIFLLGFIIGGLLFFIIGGLAGGWLMSCITKSFCKPCWRPYCPSGMRRRWRAARRVSTSAFEESGAAANSDIALAGPPMTAAELRRAWGDDRPSASSSSSSSSSPGVCAERERRARCSFGRRDTWEDGDAQGDGGGGWGAGVERACIAGGNIGRPSTSNGTEDLHHEEEEDQRTGKA
jgi:hypothetical protein